MKIFKITIPEVVHKIKTTIPDNIHKIKIIIENLTTPVYGIVHCIYKISSEITAKLVKIFSFNHTYKFTDNISALLILRSSLTNAYKIASSITTLLYKSSAFSHLKKIIITLNDTLIKYIKLNNITHISISGISAFITKRVTILHQNINKSYIISMLKKHISLSNIHDIQEHIKFTVYKIIQIPINQLKLTDIVLGVITRRRKLNDISNKTFNDISNITMHDFVYITEEN